MVLVPSDLDSSFLWQCSFKKSVLFCGILEDEFSYTAVSNLVFRPLNDAKDKRAVIKGALRVKKGSESAFQDAFLMKSMHSEVDDLLETIRSWDIESVGFLDTSHSDFIQEALRLVHIVGVIGVLDARKWNLPVVFPNK